MRVIAGSMAGRRLLAPKGSTTRPTTDRVREAMFNSLGSLGLLAGSEILDLFAGSGALGIEAISRGARAATFVDRDRMAIDAVRANLGRTGAADRAGVHRDEALRFVGRRPPETTWDGALLDPPYEWSGWDRLWPVLPVEWAVAETRAPVSGPAGWRIIRSKRYGDTWVSILARTDGGPPPTGETLAEDEAPLRSNP